MVEYCVRQRELPLAIYREVAAHLGQVGGVEVSLLPQRSPQFDYYLSQVDSLQIRHPDSLSDDDRKRLEQILAYYSDRYGVWEIVEATQG
jgi:hypothetical protein